MDIIAKFLYGYYCPMKSLVKSKRLLIYCVIRNHKIENTRKRYEDENILGIFPPNIACFTTTHEHDKNIRYLIGQVECYDVILTVDIIINWGMALFRYDYMYFTIDFSSPVLLTRTNSLRRSLLYTLPISSPSKQSNIFDTG